MVWLGQFLALSCLAIAAGLPIALACIALRLCRELRLALRRRPCLCLACAVLDLRQGAVSICLIPDAVNIHFGVGRHLTCRWIQVIGKSIHLNHTHSHRSGALKIIPRPVHLTPACGHSSASFQIILPAAFLYPAGLHDPLAVTVIPGSIVVDPARRKSAGRA